MKVSLIKNYNYIVRFYDENNNKIGYATCKSSELKELKERKEFFGKAVCRTESNRI